MTTLDDVDLDPGIRHWISLLEQGARNLPDLASPDLALQRAAGRRLSDLVAAECTRPVPEGVDIDDIVMRGPRSDVRARRYRPSAVAGAMATQLWLHGGGFISGSPDELVNERLCARRALDCGVQVLSLDYRLAPEHSYPAPVVDVLDAVEALTRTPDQFGVDPARLGIGGASAGAAIAASAALRIRDAGLPRLVHLALEVPVASFPPEGPSAETYATGFGLDTIEEMIQMYIGPNGPSDEYASPLGAGDLSGLPRTLITVAEHDPLRDSGVRLARRLSQSGVAVDLIWAAGHVHASIAQTAVSSLARDWETQVARRLRLAYSDVE